MFFPTVICAIVWESLCWCWKDFVLTWTVTVPVTLLLSLCQMSTLVQHRLSDALLHNGTVVSVAETQQMFQIGNTSICICKSINQRHKTNMKGNFQAQPELNNIYTQPSLSPLIQQLLHLQKIIDVMTWFRLGLGEILQFICFIPIFLLQISTDPSCINK